MRVIRRLLLLIGDMLTLTLIFLGAWLEWGGEARRCRCRLILLYLMERSINHNNSTVTGALEHFPV